MNETQFAGVPVLQAAGEPSVVGNWWDAVAAGFSRGSLLHPEPMPVMLIIAVAVGLAVFRPTWRWFGLYVTFVHELGHAFAALTTGRVVKGIHLNFDHSGQMTSLGRTRRGAAWAGFWGYPAPALVGAVLVWSACAGWAGAAMSLGALILLAALLFIRNLAGVLIAVGCAVVAQLLVMFTPKEAIAYVVLALGIALLVGSVKDWFKVLSVHVGRRHHVQSSDAYILYRTTGVPSAVWLTGFAVVVAACAGFAFATLGDAVVSYA
ncbi:M50 family metallopeptidase [Arthrobacter ginkgonis]|uniref:M50 family metallopeptidase n=1 Tax=Arthrobacter ginkgonis TaxID=1630594 RepID=A0ABP7DD81_9MICC